MPRFRTIKYEAFTDPLLIDLVLEARLLYAGLPTMCDDKGYIEDDPKQINLWFFPEQEYPTEALLDLLVSVDRLVRMVAPPTTPSGTSKRLLWVKNFDKHQKVNRPNPPQFGYPETFGFLPVPTMQQRLSLVEMHPQLSAGESVVVKCAQCGYEGKLRLYRSIAKEATPIMRRGAVVAQGVEIVPGDADGAPAMILCRDCRDDDTLDMPEPLDSTLFAAQTGTLQMSLAGLDDNAFEAVPTFAHDPGDDSEAPTVDSAALQMSKDDIKQATQTCFDWWVRVTGRQQTKLDSNRKTRIEWALKNYPIQDVMDALSGWRHSPFHRGENGDGRRWNNIDLLLRNSEKLEYFRDLERTYREDPEALERQQRRAGGTVGQFGESRIVRR